MGRRRSRREINIVNTSFIDVMANTIGGLAFLLVMAVLLAGLDPLTPLPPEILTRELPEAYAGHEYRCWLSAREGMGRFTWSQVSGTPPQGLTLDAATGLLSGTPMLASEAGAESSHRFTVRCSAVLTKDAEPVHTDTQYELLLRRVAPIYPTPLAIRTPPELPPAMRGVGYPLAFAAEGGQPPYAWAWKDAAAGLTLDAAGLVSGAPERTGTFAVEVEVRAANGEAQSRRFTLDVVEKYPPPPPIPPLVVETRRVPQAVARQEYWIQLAASGGSPPYRWSTVAAPPWLASADASAFTGRPDVPEIGRSSVVWEVVDSKGISARSVPIELEVLPPVGRPPPPLVLKTDRLPEARVGQPYFVAAAAEGGEPPYTWSWQPAEVLGLTCSGSTGTLAGTPTEAGVSRLVLTLVDAAGTRAGHELELRVHPRHLPLEIVTREAPRARVGQSYSFALASSGGYDPVVWEVQEGELPAGLSLVPGTGLITGEPTVPGEQRLVLAARDAEGQRAPAPLALELLVLTRAGTRKLEVTTDSFPTLIAGREAAVALACTGGESPYSWELAPAPEGMELVDGVLRGTPSRAGTIALAVKVTDELGQTAEAELPLRVEALTPRWIALLLAVLAAVAVLVTVLLLISYLRRKAAEQRPLEVLTRALPNARASMAYSVQLACLGGVPPYRWSLVDGSLPVGLELSPDGLLQGEPFKGTIVNETTEFVFTVEVRDALGNRATQAL